RVAVRDVQIAVGTDQSALRHRSGRATGHRSPGRTAIGALVKRRACLTDGYAGKQRPGRRARGAGGLVEGDERHARTAAIIRQGRESAYLRPGAATVGAG